jgi:hypothetical protein
VLSREVAESSIATTKKSGREGCGKGALAYSAAKHLAIQSIISDVLPWSWSIVLWLEHSQGSQAPSPSQFSELYGGLKQGIREPSLITGALKCPMNFDSDDVEVQLYISKLFKFIISNQKCWSVKIMEEILHLMY